MKTISRTQLAMITLASFSILSLFNYPADLLRETGRSALLSIGIAWLLVFVSAGLILGLAVRFPGQTVVEYAQGILGRPLGIALAGMVALFHLAVAVLVSEEYSRIANTVFLFRTPELVILLAVMSVAIYVASLGLRNIGRTAELVMPIVYASFLILVLIGVGRMDWVQLRPAVPADWRPVMTGVLRTFYPFLAPQVYYILPAFLDEKPNKAVPWAFLAVGLNIGLVTVVYLLTVGILGVDAPVRIRYPAIFAIQLLFVPGFFIENVGYVVAVGWTLLASLFLAFQLWGLTIVAARLFRVPERWHNAVLLGWAATLLGLRYLVLGQHNLTHHFNVHVSPAGLMVAIGFPLLLLAVAGVRGIRGPKKSKPGERSAARPEAEVVRRRR